MNLVLVCARDNCIVVVNYVHTIQYTYYWCTRIIGGLLLITASYSSTLCPVCSVPEFLVEHSCSLCGQYISFDYWSTIGYSDLTDRFLFPNLGKPLAALLINFCLFVRRSVVFCQLILHLVVSHTPLTRQSINNVSLPQADSPIITLTQTV